MNTYGGRLDTATDIVHALNQTKIPTYPVVPCTCQSLRSVSAPVRIFSATM
jgi:membrane-bound ClpP family serine protease